MFHSPPIIFGNETFSIFEVKYFHADSNIIIPCSKFYSNSTIFVRIRALGLLFFKVFYADLYWMQALCNFSKIKEINCFLRAGLWSKPVIITLIFF